MPRGIFKYLFCVFLALGCLVLIAGCDTTTDPTSGVDSSMLTADWISFVQQFAREALAAFLL